MAKSSRQSPPSSALVWRAVVATTAAVFVADVFLCRSGTPVTLSGLYLIPVLISLWLERPRATVRIAAVCAALTVLAVAADWADMTTQRYANRVVSLFGLGLVAVLGLQGLAVLRQLRESRETSATTLRSIGDGVITVDEHDNILFLNRVAERLTGWSVERAVGAPLESVLRLRREEGEPAWIDELSQPHQPRRARIVTDDGGLLPIELSRAAVAGSERAPPGASVPRGQVIVFRDIRNRLRREEMMERLAYRDELTGLPNRTALTERLGLELAHARRAEERLGVVFVDLDGFKAINDVHGHRAGDEFLRVAAARMRSALREVDTIARLGGDEFTVLLPGLTSVRDAELVAERLVESLAEPVLFEGAELSASASLGIAIHPDDGADADTLLRRADEAMYRAKQRGGAWVFHSPDALARS